MNSGLVKFNQDTAGRDGTRQSKKFTHSTFPAGSHRAPLAILTVMGTLRDDHGDAEVIKAYPAPQQVIHGLQGEAQVTGGLAAGQGRRRARWRAQPSPLALCPRPARVKAKKKRIQRQGVGPQPRRQRRLPHAGARRGTTRPGGEGRAPGPPPGRAAEDRAGCGAGAAPPEAGPPRGTLPDRPADTPAAISPSLPASRRAGSRPRRASRTFSGDRLGGHGGSGTGSARARAMAMAARRGPTRPDSRLTPSPAGGESESPALRPGAGTGRSSGGAETAGSCSPGGGAGRGRRLGPLSLRGRSLTGLRPGPSWLTTTVSVPGPRRRARPAGGCAG